MGDNVASNKQKFILPVEYNESKQADNECWRVDEANSSTKQHETIHIRVFVGDVYLHVFVVQISFSLGYLQVVILYLVSLIKFVALPMIKVNEKEGDKRIGDKQEKHIKQILLEIEWKPLKRSFTFLIDQIIVDKITKESCY